MKNIKFGIIGIGRQGIRLAEHIRKDIRHGKLVAVCRRSANGHDYSEKHGIKFYSNHYDLLNDKGIDAVIITTPSNLHGNQALDALKAGKHILVDKPIASTVEEAKRILYLAKRQKLTVGVNFPLRVNPVTVTMKKKLPDIGRLKKIQIFVSHGPIRSHWQKNIKLSSGGVILDLGSHYFDLIYFLTGRRAEKIDSAYSEKSKNEHSGFINVTYSNFSVSLVLLRNQKLRRSIVTCAGNKGFMFADYIAKEVIISNNHEVRETKCSASYDYEVILNNMVRAINKKTEIIADPKAGIHSLETVRSVYAAIKTGKEALEVMK